MHAGACNGNCTTRGLPTRGLDKSRIGQLAVSRMAKNEKLTTQSRRWHPRVVQSASWRIRELSSNRCNGGSGRECPLVVRYWAELQSVHGLRCHGNITRTRNVSKYMLVLALCLVWIHYLSLANDRLWYFASDGQMLLAAFKLFYLSTLKCLTFNTQCCGSHALPMLLRGTVYSRSKVK